MTLTINKKTYEAGELVAYVEKLEKENKLLGERCNQLLKDKGNLNDELHHQKALNKVYEDNDRQLRDRINELEQQIEKMKNFQNCDYQLHIIDCPIFKSGGHISCKECPHWILQEIKEK